MSSERPRNYTLEALRNILPGATLADHPANKGIPEGVPDTPVLREEAAILGQLIRAETYALLQWPQRRCKVLTNLSEVLGVTNNNKLTEKAVKRLKKRGVIFPPELAELEKVTTP